MLLLKLFSDYLNDTLLRRVGIIIDKKDQLWLEWTQWRRENLGKSQASERVLMSRVAARRDAFV